MVFEPVWNHRFISRVEIVWKEDIGLEGRGGYFDQYGIIRDVMQNHLMQILALVAMELPDRFEAANIAAEKVKVLRSVLLLKQQDVVLGQYGESVRDKHRFPAYAEDAGVPDDSLTPTFAAARLQIDNPRWQGVPFLVSAGKGLDSRMTEIRIHFRDVPNRMFCGPEVCPDANQLVIRVQPDEAIHLSLVNKVPGMGMKVTTRNLDLQYKEAFSEEIPDAYESLLLDVIEGDKSLFIRNDELEVAWDIFTPVLQEIEERRVVPEAYEFGGTGPAVEELFIS